MHKTLRRKNDQPMSHARLMTGPRYQSLPKQDLHEVTEEVAQICWKLEGFCDSHANTPRVARQLSLSL